MKIIICKECGYEPNSHPSTGHVANFEEVDQFCSSENCFKKHQFGRNNRCNELNIESFPIGISGSFERHPISWSEPFGLGSWIRYMCYEDNKKGLELDIYLNGTVGTVSNLDSKERQHTFIKTCKNEHCLYLHGICKMHRSCARYCSPSCDDFSIHLGPNFECLHYTNLFFAEIDKENRSLSLQTRMYNTNPNLLVLFEYLEKNVHSLIKGTKYQYIIDALPKKKHFDFDLFKSDYDLSICFF